MTTPSATSQGVVDWDFRRPLGDEAVATECLDLGDLGLAVVDCLLLLATIFEGTSLMSGMPLAIDMAPPLGGDLDDWTLVLGVLSFRADRVDRSGDLEILLVDRFEGSIWLLREYTTTALRWMAL